MHSLLLCVAICPFLCGRVLLLFFVNFLLMYSFVFIISLFGVLGPFLHAFPPFFLFVQLWWSPKIPVCLLPQRCFVPLAAAHSLLRYWHRWLFVLGSLVFRSGWAREGSANAPVIMAIGLLGHPRISKNGCGPRQCQEVISHAAHPSPVHTGNRFGDDGAALLAASLDSNSTLQTLDLQCVASHPCT